MSTEGLDELSLAILKELRRDARATHGEIARSVGCHRNTVRSKIEKMEEIGIIIGYEAIISPSGAYSYFYMLVAIDSSERSLFEEVIKSSTFVKKCTKVTGNYTYILYIEVIRNSMLADFEKDLRKFNTIKTSTLLIASELM